MIPVSPSSQLEDEDQALFSPSLEPEDRSSNPSVAYEDKDLALFSIWIDISLAYNHLLTLDSGNGQEETIDFEVAQNILITFLFLSVYATNYGRTQERLKHLSLGKIN